MKLLMASEYSRDEAAFVASIAGNYAGGYAAYWKVRRPSARAHAAVRRAVRAFRKIGLAALEITAAMTGFTLAPGVGKKGGANGNFP